MKYTKKHDLSELTIADGVLSLYNSKIAKEIFSALQIMVENGYELDELIKMSIGDILDYYDNYCKPNL